MGLDDGGQGRVSGVGVLAEAQSLGDDLLVGADAIARELNWKKPDGRWNRRRVYHLADQSRLPIHNVKGIGICARKSALRAFFAALDARSLEKTSNESNKV